MTADASKARVTVGPRSVKLMIDHVVPANSCISLPPYTEVDGYGHASITLLFDRHSPDESPVDLSVAFALDASGFMASRLYVDLEANGAGPSMASPITVSGAGTWSGGVHASGAYTVRVPVMGPFMQVFVHNRAPAPRKVSVWVYLSA